MAQRPEYDESGGPREETAADSAEDAAEEARRRREGEVEGIGHVRQEDLQPYTGLRWVGTIFKAAAIFLLVALIGEFVAGLRIGGWAALPILLGETARTFVFMVVLWGGGDLVRLLVDVGHDIRAQRIFLTRLDRRTGGDALNLPDSETGGRRPARRRSAPTVLSGRSPLER